MEKLKEHQEYILTQFFKFLKKNNVLDEYLRLLKEDNTYRINTQKLMYHEPLDFLYFYSDSKVDFLISNAFNWNYGGKTNWYYLHLKWNKYYNKFVRKKFINLKGKHIFDTSYLDIAIKVFSKTIGYDIMPINID